MEPNASQSGNKEAATVGTCTKNLLKTFDIKKWLENKLSLWMKSIY